MDDEHQVTRLLTRAADSAGDFAPVPVDELAARRARRSSARPLLAVAATVAVVAGLGVGLGVVGASSDGSTQEARHVVAAASGVSATQLKSYKWESIPAAPISTKKSLVTQWTGKELLVVGDNGTSASYDPKARRWHVLPVGAPALGVFTASAWDGKSLYVWPLTRDQLAGQSGRRYDVATNSWHTVAAISPDEAIGPQMAVVAGHVYVLGFGRFAANVAHIAEYDSTNDRWDSRASFGPVAENEKLGNVYATAAGSKIVIAAGMDRYNKKERAYDYEPWRLYTYSPGEGVQALTTLPYADDPLSAPVPAGDRVLLPNVGVSVPGGGSSSVSVNDVVDVNGHVTRTPATLTYSAPTVGKSGDVPGSIVMNQYVWTGKAFLAVEGGHRPLQAWQPGNSRWQLLTGSAESAPAGDPVWAADRLIVVPQGAAGVQGSEFAP